MIGHKLVIITNIHDSVGGNMKFDRFDVKILDALQRDGRLSVVDLAESIGLSPTPCARRIKALESEGAIEGYAALLNPARVGLAVLAIVQVKLTEHTDETVARFEREIQLMDEVTKCLAMTGSYDFILEVYGKDLEALSNVVLKKLIRVPNVRDMQSSVVLETIKRTARIPLAHLQV
jgi:Lrp/AsnC family leucine-responsive transcriptional regulator